MDETGSQASDNWPELEALAQPARERRRLSPETRSHIILELCARAALSVKELSELLDRSEAYIGDAIRPLVTEGRLLFLYPDQPRHPKQKYLAKPRPEVPRPEFPRPPRPAPTDPAPIPRALSEPAPTPAPAPAPEAVQESAAARRSTRLRPNQWSNIIVVVVVGIALSYWDVTLWPMFAIVAGVLLACVHIYTNSPQYQRFRELHSSPRTKRRTYFIVLKTTVALVEIAIVYFATTMVTPRS